jgi:hypothetical protein
VIILIIIVFVTWIALFLKDSTIVAIGTFVVLSLTLIVLTWYAYDTNSIAKVTQERWMREGVLSTTYSTELLGTKGDNGRTLFRIINPSSLIVRAKVNCNFKIYGEPVSAGSAYDGSETWLLFPQQMSQGWFEIESILQKKGKSVAIMTTEHVQENTKEQLTMMLSLEFWDELGARRELPQRLHYFDFNQWVWIPELTERSGSN